MGEIIGMKPADRMAFTGVGSTFTISPTKPRLGLAILACSRQPSMPLMPMVGPPNCCINAVSSLFTNPPSTATTISSDGASVTRSPLTKFGARFCRCIHSLITLPPPCTMTMGFPSRCSDTRSCSDVSLPPRVLPPILTTMGGSGLAVDTVVLCWTNRSEYGRFAGTTPGPAPEQRANGQRMFRFHRTRDRPPTRPR